MKNKKILICKETNAHTETNAHGALRQTYSLIWPNKHFFEDNLSVFTRSGIRSIISVT